MNCIVVGDCVNKGKRKSFMKEIKYIEVKKEIWRDRRGRVRIN